MIARHGAGRLLGLGLLSVALLITIGCDASAVGGGGGLPTWTLDFSRFRGDASYHVSPQQALADAAMAEYTPDGTLHPLASVSWLASGPGFGLAVVQLDPAGHYRNLVTLEIDPQVQSWQADAGDLPALCSQRDALPPSVPGLGANCGIVAAASGNVPVPCVIDDWTTPAGAIYVAARFDALAARLAGGAASIALDGHTGWITTTGAFTSVVVPLAPGQSFVFAGTAPPARVQQLAAIALEHTDALVPLR